MEKALKLHQQVDKLLPGPKRTYLRMIVHALIDLGKVKTLECTYEHCLYRSRKFNSGSGNANNPRGLTIDHTRGKEHGDRYENLNVMHHGCNSSKGAVDYWNRPGSKEVLAKFLSDRWKDPSYRKKRIKSMSGKNHWSQKPGMLKRYSRGKNHWTRRKF